MLNLSDRQVPVAAPLTREEAAEMLRVSIRTVDRMISAGTLRKIPLAGRLVRIPRYEVEALLSPAPAALAEAGR